MTAAAARIEIDWTRCDGHGLCAAMLPERFGVDEWGYPLLRDARVVPPDERAVRRVINTCPALALRLTRDPQPAAPQPSAPQPSATHSPERERR